VLFRLFSLSFCYIIVTSKQKRVLSFFGRENKREEHRPQTETSRIDNVDEDKLSDTDEREPFVEPKAKAARRNFQSTWLEKLIQVVAIQKAVCPPKTGRSPRKLLTGTECPPKVKS